MLSTIPSGVEDIFHNLKLGFKVLLHMNSYVSWVNFPGSLQCSAAVLYFSRTDVKLVSVPPVAWGLLHMPIVDGTGALAAGDGTVHLVEEQVNDPPRLRWWCFSPE